MRSIIRRRRAAAAVATIAAVGLLAAGCSTAPAEVTVEGGIEAVLNADPATFDPVHTRGVNDYTLARVLYDTVLRKADDGEIVAGLASGWDAVSAAEYRLTIGEGATCSDGTPIDAEVVAGSLSYLADPETGSTWKPLVFGSGDVDITTEGEEVVISLSTPFAMVLDTLTLPQAGIICPAGLADVEALGAGSIEGAFSGPYVIDEITPGLGYALKFREDYDAWPTHTRELPGSAPAEIFFSVSTDVPSIVNQLISGDLNLALLAAGESVDRVRADGSLSVVDSSDVSLYLVFNQREGRFFADQANRTALAQAVDQAAFDVAYSGSRNNLISSVASPELSCVLVDESLIVPQDAAAASAVLSGQSFKFLSYTAIAAPATDYLFSAMNATGANVTLENPDLTTWSQTINNPTADWDVAIFGDRNTARLVSASLDRFMGPSLEDGGRNVGAVDNPEGAAAIAEGLQSTDVEHRCGLFLDAQRSMMERVDIVPLVAAVQSTVTSSGVAIQAYGGSIDHSTLRITGGE